VIPAAAVAAYMTQLPVRAAVAAPLGWPRYAEWVKRMQRAFGEGAAAHEGCRAHDRPRHLALHAVMRLFSAPCALTALPAELGHGGVVLITQDLPPSVLDEARRRLAVG